MHYTLREIASWQKEIKDNNKSKITLPSLQRGFVWRPHQMETLWDSILRGYPIGSILMADNGDENKFLLDGQQRCTTIALGFNDPLSEKNKQNQLFSLKDHLPSIWIDLKPERHFTDNFKYSIRVLNRSHPWGYSQKHNTKTISMLDRQAALTYFKSKEPDTQRYTNLSCTNINPWDAHFPVPLAILLSTLEDNLQFEDFEEKIHDFIKQLRVKTKYSNDIEVDFGTLTKSDLKGIFQGVENAHKLRIPEIRVPANVLKEDIDQETESQDPTLFIRLNSSGTTLAGEELIYSIYKAAFPQSKDLVEEIGASFIAPRKIINLFSRMAATELSNFSTFPSEYSIHTFQNALKEDKYKQKLASYIQEGGNSEAENLIKMGILILSQCKEDFPAIITKQLIISNIDMFLLLLIYLKKFDLTSIEKLNTETIKDISGAYVHATWFGRDKKIASKLFSKLYQTKEESSSSTSKSLWNDAIKELTLENPEQILRLIKPDDFRKLLTEAVLTKKINHKKYVDKEIEPDLYKKICEHLLDEEHWQDESRVRLLWDDFLGKIYWNKTMLLYAQRDYINEKFKDYNQFENIEDTNRPWDWDHIYPISWVYNKNKIHDLVRSWVNSIGNLRALSYDDNRSESNRESPETRLSKEINSKTESFITEENFKFWNKLNSSHNRIMKDDEALNSYLNAIVNRMVDIYQEWYNNYYLG